MTANARGYRLTSIDMLRGLAIVIMAIDHVRDYVMVGGELDPMSSPDIGAALFFTRWITHFCAPVFVFLAGTSAGLMAARKTQSALGAFLLTRGLWLIVVELFVVATAWSFAPWGMEQVAGLVVVPMQVIWAIGASMVILAGAQRFGQRACLVIGGAILVGHNLLDVVWPVTGGLFDTASPAWAALHAQTGLVVGPFHLAFTYPLLPWIGVMLAGFGTAPLFQDPPERRDARLLAWGVAGIAAFVVLRGGGLYGDPNAWRVQDGAVPTLIDFLNVTKYPPSLLYLLMTLGPAAVLCAYADLVPDIVKQPLIVFGRVPFAFYVAHLYLIHTLAVALGVIQGFDARQFLTFSFFFPKGYGVGL
ncbi:MAG: heparan-alpha-glucosaminide N-acetyltransferase domain-containing protein, partial [Vicinamibacterales bacterium]